LAHLAGEAKLTYRAPEIQLAVSMLPVFQAMQSPIGALYYCAHGTANIPDDSVVSTENNQSAYAAFKILRAILELVGDPKELIPIIKELMEGIENYLQHFAFDVENFVFVQGGLVRTEPKRILWSKPFAVDVQTWGISAIGVAKVDEWFGELACYQIWNNTRRRAGVFDEEGNLRGLGYTDGHRIVSSEWTFGGINMLRSMANAYSKKHKIIATELRNDARSMSEGLQKLQRKLPDGTVAYLYANVRYRIPFSGTWYANPIPSTTGTAWSIFLEKHFNPFELGGGEDFVGKDVKRIKEFSNEAHPIETI
jgi:hypothetical protein